MYSETCLIRHVLGETFCVGIDRVSDYTVQQKIKSGMKFKVKGLRGFNV